MIAKLDGASGASVMTDASSSSLQSATAMGWGGVWAANHLEYKCTSTDGTYVYYGYDASAEESISGAWRADLEPPELPFCTPWPQIRMQFNADGLRPCRRSVRAQP